MRKPEKSVEPSMEEILASIRKIIAEEPAPAGHVQKEGEALPQGGQPGGPAAPPGSDLSDMFDEPARNGSDRPQGPQGPQGPQAQQGRSNRTEGLQAQVHSAQHPRAIKIKCRADHSRRRCLVAIFCRRHRANRTSPVGRPTISRKKVR